MLLRQLAQAGHLPAGFLARTLQKLRRYNLVASHRGAIRGYSLARPAHEITLREIFEAIEGPTVFRRCICSSRRSGEANCCRLHDDWAPIGARLLTVMEETTLAQVASRNSKHG
jgi:Rrf2 family protein